MRGYIPSYQLVSASSLAEALDVLAQDNGVWKPFAGGTDLMVLLEAGKLPHKNYVNIWNLKELRGIEVTDDEIILGALTTYSEVQEHPSFAPNSRCCARRQEKRAVLPFKIAARSAAISSMPLRPRIRRRRCSLMMPSWNWFLRSRRAKNSIFQIPHWLQADGHPA